MSPLFFSNHKKNNLIALFDIGSTSVGGALVNISTHQKQKNGVPPSVIWSKRKEISFQYAIDHDHFLQHIFSALKIISKAMSVEAKAHPSMIFCTFSSPWYAAQTRIAKSSLSQPSIITEPMVHSLVDAETTDFQTSEMPRHLHARLSRTTLLEQKIMRVELNGYATEAPYKKSAQTLDVALYISMSPRIFLDAANRIIGEVFHRDVDQYHSFSFVSFSALRDIVSERDTFLLCDINGEVTDISLIKDNILVESISFPGGRVNMVRDIVSTLKRPPEEVLSTITMHFNGLTDRHPASNKPKSALVIEKSKNAWLASFRKAVMELRTRNFLPADIEITAHPMTQQWLETALSNATFPLGVSGEERGFKVNFIDALFLRKHISFENASQFDLFLALEALFADKLLNLKSDTI
jgi:hypothetical protein